MKFKSAVDTWYYLLALVLPLFILVFVGVVAGKDDPSAIPIIAMVGFFSLGLSLWLLFSTHYTVSQETLTIRSGPFRWVVPLDDIQLVAPSRSVLSSPALSLDRLGISYGKGKKILVSPADRDGFLRAIGLKNGPGSLTKHRQ